MKKIYVYVMDTMADFEHGHLLQGLTLQNYLPSKEVELCTFSETRNAVKTAGGMTIVPDCTVEDVNKEDCAALVLIGGDTWQTKDHSRVLELAEKFLEEGILVAAICGATLALADRGILDTRRHTSNGAGFIQMFCKNYRGEEKYEDIPAVRDGNLITSACTGSILFAKLILESLGIFSTTTLDAWYGYFSTGNSAKFFELMNSFKVG